MSQAGEVSPASSGGSGIQTINTIGPDGSNNFTLESTDGSITFTPIANGLNLSAPGGSSSTVVTTFNSSGTWTKNAATKFVTFYILAAGSGGGSGTSSDTATPRSGGSGGGALSCIKWSAPGSLFSASETVTVGAGGLGGASVTGADGNPGAGGGDSSIGTIGTQGFILNQVSNVSGMTFGTGGSESGIDFGGIAYGPITEAFSNYSIDEFIGGNGGFGDGSLKNAFPTPPYNIGGTTPFLNGFTAFFSGLQPSGGGGGGGLSDATATENAGNGGTFYSMVNGTSLLAGGAGGTVGAGQNGSNGVNASSAVGGQIFLGTGGGGGASNATAAAGTGGHGGFPGGAGGGGGSTVAAHASGAGGAGGNAKVTIIEFL